MRKALLYLLLLIGFRFSARKVIRTLGDNFPVFPKL